jgi:hypothetical protein
MAIPAREFLPRRFKIPPRDRKIQPMDTEFAFRDVIAPPDGDQNAEKRVFHAVMREFSRQKQGFPPFRGNEKARPGPPTGETAALARAITIVYADLGRRRLGRGCRYHGRMLSGQLRRLLFRCIRPALLCGLPTSRVSCFGCSPRARPRCGCLSGSPSVPVFLPPAEDQVVVDRLCGAPIGFQISSLTVAISFLVPKRAPLSAYSTASHSYCDCTAPPTVDAPVRERPEIM